jgi:hypothetical protein
MSVERPSLSRASVLPGLENQIERGIRVKQVVLTLVTFAIVLTPEFTLLPGFYKPRGEDFILVLVLPFLVIHLRTLNRPRSEWFFYSSGYVYQKILLGMLVFTVISIGVGTIALQQNLILNDWMILPMIARLIAIFIIGQWARELKVYRVFIWILVISLGLSALVGILQYHNLLGINNWFTPLYVHENMRLVGLELVKRGHIGARVVGTHGDARRFGYILVVGIGLCISILTNIRKNAIRWVASVVLIMCMFTIPYTASRTPFLSAGFVTLVAIYFVGRNTRNISKAIGIIIVILIVFALVFPAFRTESFTTRVLRLDTVSFTHSVTARTRDLREILRHAFRNPIIWLTGRGPSKAAVRTDAHGDIAWYFYRFGLPGLTLYFLLIFNGFKFARQSFSNTEDPWGKTVSMAAFLLVLTWFIFFLVEDIFKDAQIMALNMLLIGVGSVKKNN